MKEIFEFYNADYLKFEEVAHKLSQRPDLHAFLLLDKLVPDNKDMISAVSHDEYYLCVDIEALEKVITPEQIRELVQCGISYDSQYDCLKSLV